MSIRRPIQPKRGRPPGARSFDADVAAAIGSVLKEARLASGLSQETLALMADVERSYWGRVERGQSQPTVYVLLKIAAAIGMEAAALMSQIESALAAKPVRSRRS